MHLLVDTHCHLTFPAFNKDREQVIARAKEKLAFIIEVGTNPSNNQKVLSLAAQHPNFIRPALGLHPTGATPDQLSEATIQINTHASEISAIGEIGLDYHHVKEEPLRKQHRETFRSLLSLAEKLKKPVSVHSRDAEADCLDALSSFSLPSVIMHCFSANHLIQTCLDRNYWVAVPTSVVFAASKQELVRQVGIDRLLLETDAPFISPFRASRNEPAYVEHSAKKIAEILSIPLTQVAEKTTSNAKEAFPG